MTIIGFDDLDRARAALRAGDAILLPLPSPLPYAVAATSAAVVNTTKGRPAEQPAGCLVPSLDDVRSCLDLTDDAFALAAWLADAERLTLFLPVREEAVPDWLRPSVSGGCAGLMTACLPPFTPLLDELGRLFLSSGNRTTQAPAGTAAAADRQFAGALLTLDGEPWHDPSVEHASSTTLQVEPDGALIVRRPGSNDRAFGGTPEEYVTDLHRRWREGA